MIANVNNVFLLYDNLERKKSSHDDCYILFLSTSFTFTLRICEFTLSYVAPLLNVRHEPIFIKNQMKNIMRTITSACQINKNYGIILYI